MKSSNYTSSHALLQVFADNGIDRAFLVPGESYLGVLDALVDFPEIDVITARHEGAAAFMAAVDGRITHKPGVVMVSRGPGATNASIGVHTAQQDGVPLILVVGQVARSELRMESFQEIDYQKMFGSIAKWVFEASDPSQLADAAFKAVRVATSGVPGPVVLVLPEDVQQQPDTPREFRTGSSAPTKVDDATLEEVGQLIAAAERPLIVAGIGMAAHGGREALRKLAESHRIPVVVSFRGHDIFPTNHQLSAGHLDLVTDPDLLDAFHQSDFILALGTRLGDITTQRYTFPKRPRPDQKLVHIIRDSRFLEQHYVADVGAVADPALFAEGIAKLAPHPYAADRKQWIDLLCELKTVASQWQTRYADDGVVFADFVRELDEQMDDDGFVCVDAGTFAAPIYRSFSFKGDRRLISGLSGAMGYGVPAGIASQLRHPERQVVVLAGDGGFLMTGNEIISALERKLPILFVVSNNNAYGSIRIHQAREYPGRAVGTSLKNPDFVSLAKSFGIEAEAVTTQEDISSAIRRGLTYEGPYLIEVATSLSAVLSQVNVNNLQESK